MRVPREHAKRMIRYRIATKLGLVEPLVRMQRRADAAARASARRAPGELRSI